MTVVPPLASVGDLEAWLGVSLTGDALSRAKAVLDAASAKVRAEARRDWVTDDNLLDDPPDFVVRLTVRAAAAMWANPTGATQDTAGPFSVTHGPVLAEDDLESLKRFHRHSGLYTIRTTRGPLETPGECVDVVGSDKPLPVSLDPW